jgi:hypothetical protein
MRYLKLAAALTLTLAFASPGLAREDTPDDFVFAGGSAAEEVEALLARSDIGGVQIVYTWKALEPEEGRYDFSAIERDLKVTDALGKKLFVQVQDRFFLPTARHLPQYLLTEPQYAGGLARQADNPGEGKPVATGWSAKQWNPALRTRFQALLAALAERFDRRVFGVNLPETAFDPLDAESDGFDCDAYFAAELDNARFARDVFRQSHVVQYVNFWPCEWNNDRGYMERFFAAAVAEGIGIGGPDIVPWRPGQMANAYPFLNRHQAELPMVAMAVQEPTLTYTNPRTGKPFTRAEIVDFAREYLGVDIVFWTAEAPWLQPEG